MYTIQKKANVYHKLKRKGQSMMASARPIRAQFQDIRHKESKKLQENPPIAWI